MRQGDLIMFEDILTKTYYGNTVQQWMIAFITILGIVIIGKFAFWVLGNFIKKFAAKTKSRLDDILIDEIEEPLIFALALVGIWHAIDRLNFSESGHLFVAHAFEFAIVLNVSWLLVRLIEVFYQEYLLPLTQKTDSDVDDHIFPIVRKGLKTIIWILGIIIGLNNAGYDVGAILAGLGIGGLALAMAAKNTVENIFGGFTIFSDKLFKVGDRIKAAGFDGTVEEIGLRTTRMRTLEGRLVTIPNSEFTNSPLENISSEPSRKVSLNIGVSYDTKPETINKAIKIINNIIEKDDDLLEKRYISFTTFGDFSLNISVSYYIKQGADIAEATTRFNIELLKQFNKAKIEMPFPTHTILTKKS